MRADGSWREFMGVSENSWELVRAHGSGYKIM